MTSKKNKILIKLLQLILLLSICVPARQINKLSTQASGRNYHTVEIAQLSKNIHTHIQITGVVAYVATEPDTDWHIRVCDSVKFIHQPMDHTHCVVVEQIQALQVLDKMPKVGTSWMFRGISRYDKELNHEWNEVHPLEYAKQLVQ